MISAPYQQSLPGVFTQRLEANLRALRARQPDIAAEISQARISQNLTPAVGRDGTATFLVSCEGGPAWWGGCSMPVVAAEELTATILSQSGSVTLPSMLTGMECVVLARKLAPRFAVFVVDEPASFKIAFMLRDYTDILGAGRLVVFLAGDLVRHSREFFSAHPGYAISPTLLKVPQFSPGELANLARNLEDAGAAAIQAQMSLIRSRSVMLRPDPQASFSPRPRVVILSTTDSAEAIEHAQRLESGCSSLNVPHGTCLPLAPDRCHAAARLDAAAQHRAEIVLYVSPVSNEERRFYPAETPVVFWPAANATPSPTGAAFDAVVIEDETDRARALGAGWSADRLIPLEPFFFGQGEIGDARLTPSSPIHILMDLPDDRPESAGVSLPSQLALWHAIQQEVLRRAERFALGDSGDALRRAQQASGTTLSDRDLLAQFETWICERIAPATVGRSTAKDLVRNGHTPQIWGRNWPVIGRGNDLRRGEIVHDCSSAFDSPAWVVFPWFQPAAVRLAVECLGRGCAVLMRGRPDEFARLYPGFRDLAHAIYWFGHKSAATHLRTLMSQSGKIQQTVRAAAEDIHARHTLAHRLQSLLEFVRELKRVGKER